MTNFKTMKEKAQQQQQRTRRRHTTKPNIDVWVVLQAVSVKAIILSSKDASSFHISLYIYAENSAAKLNLHKYHNDNNTKTKKIVS